MRTASEWNPTYWPSMACGGGASENPVHPGHVRRVVGEDGSAAVVVVDLAIAA